MMTIKRGLGEIIPNVKRMAKIFKRVADTYINTYIYVYFKANNK